MKIDLEGFKAYAMARAQEASTWRGVALLATAAGAHLTPDHQELIISGGLAAAGALGALFPDAKKKD